MRDHSVRWPGASLRRATFKDFADFTGKTESYIEDKSNVAVRPVSSLDRRPSRAGRLRPAVDAQWEMRRGRAHATALALSRSTPASIGNGEPAIRADELIEPQA
jgi:hypothetical protein